MPEPLTMAAISAGSGLLSTATNALFNDKPSVPDYSAEAYEQYKQKRADLDQSFQERAEELEATLAASGKTGSAGAQTRSELFSANNEAMADISAKGADAVTKAENREKEIRYNRNMGEYQRRAQGISDLISGTAQMYGMQLLRDESSGDDGDEE